MSDNKIEISYYVKLENIKNFKNKIFMKKYLMNNNDPHTIRKYV